MALYISAVFFPDISFFFFGFNLRIYSDCRVETDMSKCEVECSVHLHFQIENGLPSGTVGWICPDNGMLDSLHCPAMMDLYDCL